MFSLSSVILFWHYWNARSGFLRFFNLYDKSLPENQTKRGEIDSFRTISKVLVYVFWSKRIDFRAILRNTLGTPQKHFRNSSETLWELLRNTLGTLVDSGLSP